MNSTAYYVHCTPLTSRNRRVAVMSRQLTVFTFVTLLSLASSALADGKLLAVNVYPPDIRLNTKADLQRFVVVATRDDGVTLDVTSTAKVKFADPKLCRLENS